MIEILLLGPGDEARLGSLHPDVFDGPIRDGRLREFLEDPRHHLAVAVDDDLVVGFGSAVHYVHPDKEPELWINEVGVAAPYRRRGLARALLRRLFRLGEDLGCREAWVLTERENGPAVRLYAALDGSASEAVMFSFRLGGEDPAGRYSD